MQAENTKRYLNVGEGYGGEAFKVGSVVREGDDYLYVVSADSEYIRRDGMSFGVGDEEGRIYSATCRPATADEIKAVQGGTWRKASPAFGAKPIFYLAKK